MKSRYKNPMVIAEIGCNHKGEMSIAKDLLNIASQCGVQVAKFQKRYNQELLTEEQYNAPHPNPINSYGNTYGSHREFLEFDVLVITGVLSCAYDTNHIKKTIIKQTIILPKHIITNHKKPES